METEEKTDGSNLKYQLNAGEVVVGVWGGVLKNVNKHTFVSGNIK